MRTLLSLIIVFAAQSALAVPPECGAWPKKVPWQWSDEERIEHRFDAACVEARRAAAGDKARHDGWCSGSPSADFVFGTDTPELFMPFELFDNLIRFAIESDSKIIAPKRESIVSNAAQRGVVVPDDFWDKTFAASRDYIDADRDRRQLGEKLNAPTTTPADRRAIHTALDENSRKLCSLRAAALQRARSAFEPELFDKVLYTGVAPGLCSGGDGDARSKRWVTDGCL